MASYQTIRKLSDGAAADVFLARGDDQHKVILEILRPELTIHGDLVERFLGEARLRSQLEHPNLARRVRGGHTRDGRPYVVTELPGETLRTYLQARGALTARQVCELALPLGEALAYLHERGVVHKNLTPASVFLPGGLEAMQPKLFDASLSLMRAGTATTPRHGTCVVEAAYMAPERVAGQRADIRSDVFSLGVLLHEALTGTVPNGEARPPAPGQEALLRVIHRCLSRQPTTRYPTARAVVDALKDECRHTLVLEDEPIPPAPGIHTLGPYELIDVLGEGAIGQVFKARHQQTKDLVALKVLRPEHLASPRLVKRFRDEARAVNVINHPHIVQMVDFCDEPLADGTLYCAMEFLEGCTLETVLQGEALSLDRAVRIAAQVAEALAAAHAVGVVHRDVKPANIFLLDPGERDFVKLLDFGVAKLRLKDEPSVDTTQQGALLGTPSYMAPEQAASGEIDARADVYALGTTLYRMLAGCLPFGGPSFNEFVSQVLHDPPAPLPNATLGGEPIPAALSQLVLRCLEKKPEARPATAQALVDALEACGSRRARRVPWRGLAAAAAVAMVAATAWGARARLFRPPPATPSPVDTQIAAPAPVPAPAPASAVSAAPAAEPTPAEPAPKPAKRTHGTKHRRH